MWKKVMVGALAVLGLTSPAVSAGKEGSQVVPPAGYRLELTFTSSVPDDYYVLSGPAQSYARFRVNDQLRKALEGYSARADRAAGGVPVRLSVHLESVTTDYHQLGASLRPNEKSDARLVGFNLGWGRGRDLDRDIPTVPEKITKSVVLMVKAEISRPGNVPRQIGFHASATEVIDRDHWDLWAYDYGNVIQTAVQQAVLEVDRVTRQALE